MLKGPPRYLYVENGQYLGKSGERVRRLLLVEQPDGSWRKISGKDLVELHERFPNFLKSLEPLDWSDL